MFAEHAHLAGLDDLHADDRAHQRGLAAPAWAKQTRHRPGSDLQTQAVDHHAPASRDMQILDLNCDVGHLPHKLSAELCVRLMIELSA